MAGAQNIWTKYLICRRWHICSHIVRQRFSHRQKFLENSGFSKWPIFLLQMCFLTFPINLAASSNVPPPYQSPRLPHIKTNVSSAETKGSNPSSLKPTAVVGLDSLAICAKLSDCGNSIKCPFNSIVHSEVRKAEMWFEWYLKATLVGFWCVCLRGQRAT